MAQGGGSAYIRLQKPEDTASQSLQYWGGIKARENEADKERQETIRQEKNKALQDWSTNFDLDMKKFQGAHTGFTKYDDIINDGVFHLRDEFLELSRLENEALSNNDIKLATKYSIDKKRILSDIDVIKQGDATMTKIFGDYQKASLEGKVSPASKPFESIMKAIYLDKDAAIRYQKNADGSRELVVTGLSAGEAEDIGLNVDGNLEKDTPFVIPFQSILSGDFKWIEPVDYSGKDGMLNELSALVGLMTKDTISGDYKYTDKSWDETIIDPNSVKSLIRTSVNNDEISDLLTRPEFQDIPKDISEKEKQNLVIDRIYEHMKLSKEQSHSKEARRMTPSEQKAESAKDRAASAARNSPRQSKEEMEWGVRKFNIRQVQDSNDVSFFGSGDFKWNGVIRESQGAYVLPDGRIMIKTDEGNVFVDKNNALAVNDLFNAFEGSTTKFQDVVTVPEYQWRNEQKGQMSDITSLLDGQYDDEGNYVGDDDDLANKLKKLYPSVKITVPYSFGEKIKVNGKTINVNRKRKEVERDIKSALNIENKGILD